MLREDLAVGLTGIGLVLTGTPALVRLLSSLLYEVHAFDPKTFLTASVWLMGSCVIFPLSNRTPFGNPSGATPWGKCVKIPER